MMPQRSLFPCPPQVTIVSRSIGLCHVGISGDLNARLGEAASEIFFKKNAFAVTNAFLADITMKVSNIAANNLLTYGKNP